MGVVSIIGRALVYVMAQTLPLPKADSTDSVAQAGGAIVDICQLYNGRPEDPITTIINGEKIKKDQQGEINIPG